MENWKSYTDDFDGPDQSYPSLLPSSLKDVWEDPMDIGRSSSPQDLHVMFPESRTSPSPDVNYPGSAPSPSYLLTREVHSSPSSPQRNISLTNPQINNNQNLSATNSGGNLFTNGSKEFCSVQFHPNRIQVLSYPSFLNLNPGDYVITDADRGFDIGVVTDIGEHPSPKDAKMAKAVLRKAQNSDFLQIPIKEEKERNALQLCQAKVQELGLPMQITGAEYQYDGKKLTFYYAASSYVDFRSLVRVLFRIFGTRIWMIWYDGTAPVKDVLTRTLHRNSQ